MTFQIPGYTLKREIGIGGMASVYLAIQDSLERLVALKVMSPALSADRTFTKRFLREAKTVAALSHPNIVSIYDFGVTGDHQHYFSMEYLPNGDFAEGIRRGVPEPELIKVLTAIARALSYAHHRGFVHRDVKPGNILFDATNHPVLTDFGIARAATQTSRVTGSGVSVGTSHYMSPEQARGKDVDARSDLYSLGVVAFEALAGNPPYDGEDGFAIAYCHVFDPIPGLPGPVAHWQPFIDKALAKDPGDRFASAEEMIEAMAVLGGGDTAVRGPAAKGRDEPTTPLPSLGGSYMTRRLKVVRSILKGVPGTYRYRLHQAISAAFSALGTGWKRFARAVFFFVPRPYRPLAGLIAVFAVVAAVAMLLTWPQRTDEPPALADDRNSAPAEPEPADAASNPLLEAADPVERDDYQESRPLVVEGFESDGESLSPAPAEPEPQRPTPEEMERVAELLGRAEADFKADRLTTPVGNSAFDRYRAVLQLQPGNRIAARGLNRIIERYIELARDRTDAWSFEDALTFLERAEAVAQAVGDRSSAEALDGAREYVWRTARRAADDALGRQAITDAVNYLETALSLKPEDPEMQAKLEEARQQPPLIDRFRDRLSGGGLGPEMAVVSLEPYRLSTPEGEIVVDDNRRVAIAVTEITREQFAKFVEMTDYYGRNKLPSCRDQESRWRSSRDRTWVEPGFPVGWDHPVVCVDWNAATAYAQWLSSQTGLSYRLPTETEWEYVAAQPSPQSNSVCDRANVGDLWLKSVLDSRTVQECEDGWTYTSPVGAFPENAVGVKGIIGNVREWTADCWHDSRSAGASEYQPSLDGDCGRRVVKDVSWLQGDDPLNLVRREGFDVDDAFNTVGFRVVRTLD